MKRRDLLRQLAAHGWELLREGARHSVYYNPATGPHRASRGTPTSMTSWRARLAETLGFHPRKFATADTIRHVRDALHKSTAAHMVKSA